MSIAPLTSPKAPVFGYADGDVDHPVVAWFSREWVVQWHEELHGRRKPWHPDIPWQTLTVVNRGKWYGFHYIKEPVVRGDDIRLVVSSVDPSVYIAAEEECVKRYGDQAYIGDHIYHPALFVEAARILNLRVCEQSLNMVTGRWAMEWPNGYGDKWLMDAPGL